MRDVDPAVILTQYLSCVLVSGNAERPVLAGSMAFLSIICVNDASSVPDPRTPFIQLSNSIEWGYVLTFPHTRHGFVIFV